MSWFSSSKLPVTEEERDWVDGAFRRLERLLGRDRMINAKMILPSDYYFPDAYDRTPAAADALFRRLCGYMDVDSAATKLEVFQDETEELRNLLPHWSSPGNRCAAGLYWRGMKEREEGGDLEPMVIALRSSLLKDPYPLIATIAHELGHAILIGRGLIDTDTTKDHEPLTDLLTV